MKLVQHHWLFFILTMACLFDNLYFTCAWWLFLFWCIVIYFSANEKLTWFEVAWLKLTQANHLDDSNIDSTWFHFLLSSFQNWTVCILQQWWKTLCFVKNFGRTLMFLITLMFVMLSFEMSFFLISIWKYAIIRCRDLFVFSS